MASEPRKIGLVPEVRRLALLLVLGLAVSSCGGSGAHKSVAAKTLTVVVNAPFSTRGHIGETIDRGVRLALQNISSSGRPELMIGKTLTGSGSSGSTTALSPARGARATSAGRSPSTRSRSSTDGTGVDASWKGRRGAHIPIAIVYDGGVGPRRPAKTRPNVFRIAPTNHGIAFRLAEYLIPKGLKIALLTRRHGLRPRGRAALDNAFAQNPESVADADRAPRRRRPTSRRRSCTRAAPARPRCSSGPSRRRSPRS